MSNLVLSGLTTITTISLLEEYNINNLIEDIKNVFNWFHSQLPCNKFVRLVVYTSASVLLARSVPLILRNTKFFQYFDRQHLYFHRTSNHKRLLELKDELLSELHEEGAGGLPLYNSELIILELNIGGGTNISYYPEGAHLIATDFLEGNREKLESNILISASNSRVTLDTYIETGPEELNSVPDSCVSCVICFHSLCSTRNTSLALLEIKRVLMPGGKLYFIEHTTEPQRYIYLGIISKFILIFLTMFNLLCD